MVRPADPAGDGHCRRHDGSTDPDAALPQGRAVTIAVTVGSLRIDGWDKADAEISIERHVPTPAHQAQLPVIIDDTPSRVVIRAVQTDGGTDPALRTDIVIRVPRTALIESVRIMEGRLVIAGFRGSITADIRRGPIEIRSP